jgi:4-alpha-glucanotransferase
MNLPGTGGGNWAWRFEPGQCTEAVLERLAAATELFGRAPRPPVAD